MSQPDSITATPKGEFVPFHGMAMIVSGAALAVRSTEKNHIPLAGTVYGPNSWFGAYPVVTGLNTWRLQVLSSECLCAHYHYDKFTEVFGTDKLLELLAQETTNFESALLRVLNMPLNERVYHAVTEISEELKKVNPEMTRFRVSRDVLGSMVGSSRECVSRCLTDLSKAGRLKIESCQFVI